MESETVPSQHQEEEEEEEYVLLDLDSVYSQLQIPPNAPYVLSGLDTMNPVLILDDKFKLIGQWDETIGTCLLFKEEGIVQFHPTRQMPAEKMLMDSIVWIVLGNINVVTELSLLFTKKQDPQKLTFLLENA